MKMLGKETGEEKWSGRLVGIVYLRVTKSNQKFPFQKYPNNNKKSRYRSSITIENYHRSRFAFLKATQYKLTTFYECFELWFLRNSGEFFYEYKLWIAASSGEYCISLMIFLLSWLKKHKGSASQVPWI